MKTIPALLAIVTLLLLTISVPLTKEDLLTAEEFYSMFKPDNSNHQFAVLFVTKASGEPLNPPPKGYDQNGMMIGDNYVANVYKKGVSTGHTEPTVLDCTNYLLENFREKQQKVEIINDPEKWVDYLNGLLGRKCIAFSTIVKECHEKTKTRSCVVGPPLDPYTEFKASSRLEDLHGALDIKELNFILAKCNPLTEM